MMLLAALPHARIVLDPPLWLAGRASFPYLHMDRQPLVVWASATKKRILALPAVGPRGRGF